MRRHVPARLWLVALFGSRARGDARPDSDVDLLFVFERLPPDREPQATQVEEICRSVAHRRGVPVSPWSVSLQDLECGRRTPMLVDALTDGRTLWPAGRAVPRLRFTRADAAFCVGALLSRVAEGSVEVADARRQGANVRAWRRVASDVVRLCTAALLLQGETRPRRGRAVCCFLHRYRGGEWLPSETVALLAWAARTAGSARAPLLAPPFKLARACAEVESLRRWVAARAAGALREDAPAG